MSDKLATVRKLLAKAERAGTPEEAEAFRAKATEWMIKHSIDEAMLAADHDTGDRIGYRRFVITRYAKPKAVMLSGIAGAFGARTVRLANESTYGTAVCMVYGWEFDLEMIEVLFASLEIQAMREVKPAHQKQPHVHGMAFTTSFLFGFGATVATRLQRQRQQAVDDRPGTGTELVLVDRTKAVDAHLARQHGNLRAGKRATVSTATAFHSGVAAGHRADLGQGGLGCTRKAVGR